MGLVKLIGGIGVVSIDAKKKRSSTRRHVYDGLDVPFDNSCPQY
jgi:hypothetical protein